VDIAALVEEATKKSGMLWLALPDLPYPRAAWHVWHTYGDQGAAYVVTGGIEQPLPGLPEAERITVTVRSKDKGGRLVSWHAKVVELAPESEEWAAAVAELKGKRLNAPDGEAMTGRWARECRVLRLEPTGATTPLPDGSLAEAPLPTPATTRQPMPAALHRLLLKRKRRR
jgi:hypothetical protein